MRYESSGPGLWDESEPLALIGLERLPAPYCDVAEPGAGYRTSGLEPVRFVPGKPRSWGMSVLLMVLLAPFLVGFCLLPIQGDRPGVGILWWTGAMIGLATLYAGYTIVDAVRANARRRRVYLFPEAVVFVDGELGAVVRVHPGELYQGWPRFMRSSDGVWFRLPEWTPYLEV